jgi:hypothetical protein
MPAFLERPKRSEKKSTRRGVTPRTSSQLKTVSESDVLALLNDDLIRECQEIDAFSYFAEQNEHLPAFADQLLECGRQTIPHAHNLRQIILELGGEVRTKIDEGPAFREPMKVNQKEWESESTRRLRERAGQLIQLGEVRLAVRIFRLIAEKQLQLSLETLLNRHSKGIK